MAVLDIDTPHGLARAHLEPDDGSAGALVLGHGAGGGVSAPDLVAVAGVARSLDVTVALVEQPYSVAGKRSAAPAPKLDEAWVAVLEHLRADALAGLTLVTGGRSSGARVACRTAAAVGAAGVLCLAFPLHPPGRPDKSRLEELDAVTVPTLIVQGESDPFGMPPAAEHRQVVRLRGNHSLRSDAAGLREAVRSWLPGVL